MSQSIKKYLSITLFLLMFTGSLLFFLKNNQMITFDYLIASQEISLSLLLFLAFTMGALFGVLVGLLKIFSLKYKIRKLQKQVKLAEKELSNLRVMPMKHTF